MGYDISAHSEVKINGTWDHLSELNIRRNYALFSLMAGLFDYEDKIVPIAEPRGLPLDCTFLTSFIQARELGHTHSWLSADEVSQVGQWLEKKISMRPKRRFSGISFGVDGTNFQSTLRTFPKGLKMLDWFFGLAKNV